jgi:hypothetical protein
MNAIDESLLRDQMKCDTLWCLPCGLNQTTRRATLRYTVETDGLSAPVLACRDCLTRALADAVPIVASEPIIQLAYLDLLDRALGTLDR